MYIYYIYSRLMKLTRSVNQIFAWHQDHAETETKLQVTQTLRHSGEGRGA